MMRRKLTLAVMAFTVLGLEALAWNQEVLAKIEKKKARAERMDAHKRGEIYSEISLALTELLSWQVAENSGIDGTLTEVLTYSRKATESAKMKGKGIKDTEINLRKAARRLEDISRAVTFAERAPLKRAIGDLDKLRNDLLHYMFAKKN